MGPRTRDPTKVRKRAAIRRGIVVLEPLRRNNLACSGMGTEPASHLLLRERRGRRCPRWITRDRRDRTRARRWSGLHRRRPFCRSPSNELGSHVLPLAPEVTSSSWCGHQHSTCDVYDSHSRRPAAMTSSLGPPTRGCRREPGPARRGRARREFGAGAPPDRGGPPRPEAVETRSTPDKKCNESRILALVVGPLWG